MFALCRRGGISRGFRVVLPLAAERHRLNKQCQCQLLLLFCVHSLQLMPSSAHERIDRLARHLSASGAGATTRSVVSSPMAAQLTSHTRPPITSHALDTATGKPARGLPLKLEQLRGAVAGSWLALGATTTDEDGRAPGLLVPGTVSAVLRCRSEWSCPVCLRLTCTSSRQQLLLLITVLL